MDKSKFIWVLYYGKIAFQYNCEKNIYEYSCRPVNKNAKSRNG
jgi:hypothetical protein